MANTKAIKFTQGNFTYLPVTNASLVQYTYNGGGKMSVQDAIGSLAAASLPLSKHVEGGEALYSYAGSTDILLSGIHAPGTSTVSLGGDDEVLVTGATEGHIDFAHAKHTATASGGTDTDVAGSANKQSVITGLTVNGAGHITGYTTANIYASSTQPGDADLTISGNSGSNVAFNADEQTAKTVSILGNSPISTAVTSDTNGTKVAISHSASGVTAGTYGTNSETSISASAGTKETATITIPEVAVNSYGHVTSATNQDIEISIDLTSLTGAMHWVGVSSTDPKGASGATVSGHTTWASGDVVSYNSKEYVLTGSTNAAANWSELGDEGSWALKTISVNGTDGLTGGGTLTENRNISHAVPTGASAGAKEAAANNFITSVTTDKFGHVTAYTTGTFTYTHQNSKNIMGNGASATADGAATNGNVYLRHFEDSTATSTHKITGAGETLAYTDASGNLTIYTPAPVIPDVFNAFGAGADVTTKKDGITANDNHWAPDDSSSIVVRGGNAWIESGVSQDGVLDIGHAVKFASAYSTSKVYNVKIDEAGHISEAAVASTGTVGLSALKYTASTVDVDDFTLNIGWSNTSVDVAELTGDTTFVKQA